MKKLNSKGSSLLHIGLILVIVGIIAGVGYYVYSSQKSNDSSAINTAKLQTESSEAEKTDNEFIQTLEVKELNLKLTIKGDIGQATYAMQGIDGAKYAKLSTDRLTKLDESCSATNYGSTVYLHSEDPNSVSPEGTKLSEMFPQGLIIGEKYVYITKPTTGSCMTTQGAKDSDNIEKTTLEALYEAKVEQL